MSIIYEALKKVQKNITSQKPSVVKSENCLDSNIGQTTPIHPKSKTPLINGSPPWFEKPPSSASQKSIRVPSFLNRSFLNRSSTANIPSETRQNFMSKNKIFLYVSSVFSLLLIFSLLFSLYLKQSYQAPLAQNMTSLRRAPAPMRAAPRSIPSEFIISGIMSRQDKNLALINNNIYQAGDMIGDIKIMEITTDSVKILDHGESKILKIQSKN